MKKITILLFAFLMFGSIAVLQADATPKMAKAALQNAAGESVGSATLTELENGGVKIDLEVKNLTPGQHAFHIHNVGKCEAPDFKSAGPHFNPEGKQHGTDNPQGPHAGDMPNVTVGADGSGKAEVVASHATLDTGTNSVFHEGGSALVIHAAADDYKTDSAGNAGARVACGVITE